MVEIHWWQAALLSVAGAAVGGLISLVAAYFTQRWAASNSLRSDERQTKRRVEEEQRQVIRQMRQERVQPIREFIEFSKQQYASQTAEFFFDEFVEQHHDEMGVELGSEALRELKRKVLGDGYDWWEIVRRFYVAHAPSLSIPALWADLLKIYAGWGLDLDTRKTVEWGIAITSAEEIIEQYLAGAEPRGISAPATPVIGPLPLSQS